MTASAEIKLDLYRKAANITDVAAILDLAPAHISYAIYHMSDAKKYKIFLVPKKSGGARAIKAPHKTLKAIQKRLANDLLQIEAHLEAERIKKRDCILAHGFKQNLSIMTNGENHRHRRYVFNIDIKDFFPAINFGRVYGFFLKNKSFELHPKVAATLAQIACFENQLPQGSPCSPVISNLIAGAMDIRLNELAQRFNCTYTRYADDLTFSTSEKFFPSAIGKRSEGSLNVWEAGSSLLKVLRKAGFELNPTKTRMQLCWSRQDVTGVVVNQKVNIPVDYYETVAAMCHYLFMDGECFEMVDGIKKPMSIDRLRGRLAYIYQVRGMGPKPKVTPLEEGEEKTKKTKPWASTKLFERFVDYADLYGVERPVVLCEGVTDNIYIKSAIQALAVHYPTLTSPAGELKIKQFKYTKTSAALQQLSGGAGELGKLANTYPARTKKFKAPARHPLIVVADSDDGSSVLFAAVKNKTGKAVGTAPWFYMGQNMYVIPIPKLGETPTPIERLFEQTLLETIYQGKKFNDTNAEKDPAKFYSKKVFATKIVAANKANINFDGFKPLLKSIAEVIEDFKKRVHGPVLATAAAPAR